MIKIIKEGHNYRPTASCGKCGCIFSYDKIDLYSDYISITITSTSTPRFIFCPCCGTKIYIYGYSEGTIYYDKNN